MILLDTHVLHWYELGVPGLGTQTIAALDAAWQRGEIVVSAVSFWELALHVMLRRIELDRPIAVWRRELLAAGLRELPLDGAIAIASVDLRNLHKDPADRFIAATALAWDATLVTADRKLLAWEAPVVRIDARR
ncbi:MAG TPA: type II toxin-antitoxin system VapC family toxin [Geminicoccaceae bacterium]|nr:type II toxin-antitoxin system VapC family toxin [Geminicoccus sp.]HMU48950.1 type II toxin-antitoxin system VapC family toxin [Geminicoccaceae bacterium]